MGAKARATLPYRQRRDLVLQGENPRPAFTNPPLAFATRSKRVGHPRGLLLGIGHVFGEGAAEAVLLDGHVYGEDCQPDQRGA
jgi:hypothetical protein